MKAIDRPFTKIINGTTQFKIPVFQRDYSWTDVECMQLWKDILQVADEPVDRGHFLGSVVYISTGDSSAGFTRWLLIDGQQRVTTLILLLTALRDHIKESGWTGTQDGPTAIRVEAYFLKNLQEEGDRAHKLVLRRRDQATLQALISGQELPKDVSEPIRDNYEYFRERLIKADPEKVWAGIGRLVVVDVTLDRATDDPQLIFESLNSTGLDLSQSDLIRNFILMRVPEPEQTRLYESYWTKIEDLFRGSEGTFDAFVRDYVALQTKASRQEKANEIYFGFRRHFSSLGSEEKKLEVILAELLRYARYHAAFSMGVGGTDRLREPLARLRRQVDVPATLVMRLYECHEKENGTLNEIEFVQALDFLESYVFRRAMCGEQTRGYWQVFATMAYHIDKDQPFKSLTVLLARQRDNYRFPNNDDFRKALEERDIYGKRTCLDLLERLEKHDNKEPTDMSKLSIEHIMPQNEKMTMKWREMLGSNWRDVHSQWLHRLGNLTLTGYNSSYSDRAFDEKKNIKGGFADSSVRLNRFVREQPVWTAKEMEKRGKDLAGLALQIWPPLVVEKSLIDEAAQIEKQSMAERSDVAKIKMTAEARALFDIVRLKVLEIDGNIIELAEEKSVSFHASEFFLEVIPVESRCGAVV